MASLFQRRFLGCSFWVAPGGKIQRRVASKPMAAFRQRVRKLTRRAGGRSLEAATLFIGNCWLRELALMLLHQWRPTPAAGGAAAGCS